MALKPCFLKDFLQELVAFCVFSHFVAFRTNLREYTDLSPFECALISVMALSVIDLGSQVVDFLLHLYRRLL